NAWACTSSWSPEPNALDHRHRARVAVGPPGATPVSDASGFPPLVVATFMPLVTTRRRRDPVYVMGRSEDETRRLEERAKFFEPLTRHFFQDAGICAGMRVLDLGSGAGDVSFLVADLVGPTGSVVGVDVNPDVVRTASTRAHTLGLTHVCFMSS